MPILIDFHCAQCGTRDERWAPSPPPSSVECIACGGEARRAWAPVGLLGRGSTSASDPDYSTASGSGTRMCQQYPQIPGLCHMSPSAQRRWVAAYTRDNRALDQELARQENAAAVKRPEIADAISHHHNT